MRVNPAWASWCKLVELFAVVMQHELELSDVERIDELALEYLRLFRLVPEYWGFVRPKHAFPCALSHRPVEVWACARLHVLWL